MSNQDNIRSLAIVSHLGYGKSTLSNLLFDNVRIVIHKGAGEAVDPDAKENDQTSTVSAGFSMYYKCDAQGNGAKD